MQGGGGRRRRGREDPLDTYRLVNQYSSGQSSQYIRVYDGDSGNAIRQQYIQSLILLYRVVTVEICYMLYGRFALILLLIGGITCRLLSRMVVFVMCTMKNGI